MVILHYEIWDSSPSRKESGPHEKEFKDSNEMHNWIATQNEHPWLYIKVIASEEV